jgi:hypothetical protein
MRLGHVRNDRPVVAAVVVVAAAVGIVIAASGVDEAPPALHRF